MSDTLALAGIFGQISVLAIGGTAPLLPEMQRQLVDVHHFMTRSEFAALFALAQAAPGPNMMVSTLIGWRVAGLPGALTATGALIGPSSLLTYVTAGAWHRFRNASWRQAVQAGLTPVAVGLVGAGAALLSASTTKGLLTVGITLVTAAGIVCTRLHPLWLLAAGALLNAAFG